MSIDRMKSIKTANGKVFNPYNFFSYYNGTGYLLSTC